MYSEGLACKVLGEEGIAALLGVGLHMIEKGSGEEEYHLDF